MGVKNIVKRWLIFQSNVMTWELNLCQKFLCNKKHHSLLKRQKINKSNFRNLKDYKLYFRRFGLDVPDIDYFFFASYLSEYGMDGTKVIPEEVIQNIVNPILNPIEYRFYYQDKNNFDRILPAGVMPPTILRRIGGRYYGPDYSRIIDLSDESLYLLTAKYEKVIVKPTVESSSGNGINLFVNEEGHFKHIANDSLLSLEYLHVNYDDDFIIQEGMSQSSALAIFNSASVNTIRLCIYRSVVNDDIKILWHILRIGKSGAFVDNAHAGGAFIGINKYGALDNHLLNQYGDKFSSHNGIDFSKESFRIPNWNAVVEFSKMVGRNILHHRLIQLDVMLDADNNPRLIEYNIAAPGIWVAMFTGQYVLSDYSDEVLEYCVKNLHRAKKTVFIPA